MVLIVYKKSEKNTFAIDSHPETKVSAILAALIECITLITKSIIWESTSIDSSGASNSSPIKEYLNLQICRVFLGRITRNINMNSAICPNRWKPMGGSQLFRLPIDSFQINTIKDTVWFLPNNKDSWCWLLFRRLRKFSSSREKLQNNSSSLRQYKIWETLWWKHIRVTWICLNGSPHY